jgi:hypothetical protein
MDNILIPIEQYPDQTMRMDLDGKPTTIRLYWSDFDESHPLRTAVFVVAHCAGRNLRGSC